jgi:hypothetical protein
VRAPASLGRDVAGKGDSLLTTFAVENSLNITLKRAILCWILDYC